MKEGGGMTLLQLNLMLALLPFSLPCSLCVAQTSPASSHQNCERHISLVWTEAVFLSLHAFAPVLHSLSLTSSSTNPCRVFATPLSARTRTR